MVAPFRFLEIWAYAPPAARRENDLDRKMFAVIKTGGKQYRVAPTDVLAVDRLDGAAGDAIAFNEVLMVGDDAGTTLGAPLVAGATVSAEIVDHKRTPTILVFKKRRRQNSKRRRGHRQQLTLVKITGIEAGGQSAQAAG
jgi:large subunit ribosomal protein L21